jgi:tyrosyl-tRNA synthetase
MDTIDELLTRGVANIISGKAELRKQLESGKKLTIYFGIDPTSTKIHLGHAVPLRKLQAFAALGHHVTFLIGDFTSLIGDTSDKDTERPVLTVVQIKENFQTYKKQAEKIVDFSKVKVIHNSDWLKKLTFEDIVKLTQHFSVGDFVGRELIRKRLNDNKRVGLHEFLYPVMQGYDSYFLDTDLQIGGTDQTFNMQAGRTLQKDLRQKESFILTTTILEGTDGRKMSKSWGNAIWLDENAENMYAKVMAVDDALLPQYYLLATDMPLHEVQQMEVSLTKKEIHPMEAKKKLAHHIVSELHSKDDAERAAKQFVSRVQEGDKPEDMETMQADKGQTIIDVLVSAGFASSKSDARRLVEQGGVKVNEVKVSDPGTLIENIIKDNEAIMQVGPRKFVQIKMR